MNDTTTSVTAGTGLARTDATGDSLGVGVTISNDMGLTLGAYGATLSDDQNNNGLTSDLTGDTRQDAFDGTWFANYSMGPVSVGYQTTYVDRGIEAGATDSTTAKTVGTSGGIFEGEAVSVAFNVNDDLSISYTDKEDTYDNQDDKGTSAGQSDVTMSTESIQVAYSMGSMSIKAYQTETTNPNFDDGAATRSVTEVALGIAF